MLKDVLKRLKEQADKRKPKPKPEDGKMKQKEPIHG
jgi:hypothetical protein